MKASAGALLCAAFFALAASPLVAGPAPATIEFRGDIQAQWEVVPSRRSITVSRGEVFEAEFRIRNKSEREILAEVLTAFGPPGAESALVHLGCGSTTSLILKPGEVVAVPSSYFVAENAPENAESFHMSYSVYSFEDCLSGLLPIILSVSCAGRVIGEYPLKFWERRRETTGIHDRNLASDYLIGNKPDRQ